ncbi:alpha,alpha-trehalose-phosphate synthase (UDP-forming) [Jatrophihabitans sp. YIM 134969]
MSAVVASNRGPLSVTVDADGEDRVERGGGGLVTGMVAALEQAEDAVWVCAALNDRERALARRAGGGPLASAGVDTGALDVRMLPIDANTFRQAYTGIANSTLWYVHHLLFDRAYRPAFDAAWRKQWEGYRRYNRRFADAMAEVADPGSAVMVQDYHLFLAPGQLRAADPDTRISHFTHTPWAPVDSFRMLPDDVATELLQGLLGADLVGFHTRRWADAFLECVEDTLGLAVDDGAVIAPDGRVVRTGVFPLGVDADALHERAHRRDAERAFAELRDLVGDRKVITRVDRTELSKNILRGLLAYRELLRTHPEWHDRVVHIAYADPSRLDLPDYREYVADVERVGAEIADEFGTDEWTPLLLDVEGDYPASLAAQRLADVVFVNPVRDGMNLVVKEGALLSEKDAVVVLSREAGAVPELGADALLVNPFDVSGTAATLHAALTMSADDRARRAANLRRASAHGGPRSWFEDQLAAVRTA